VAVPHLKKLRAALRFYKREVDGELIVPAVTLPSKASPRVDHFLTRKELANRLRIARRPASLPCRAQL
jgi:hypothetical protein